MKALFAVSVLAATCVATPAVAQDLGIEVGTTAPAVSVQALDGKTVSLANYFGIDPLVVRLIFVAGTLIGFGSFIIVYLLIWLLAK